MNHVRWKNSHNALRQLVARSANDISTFSPNASDTKATSSSVLNYNFIIDFVFAAEEQTRSLDSVLSSELLRSPSDFVRSERLADLYQPVVSANIDADEKVIVLLYNTAAPPSKKANFEYGYVSGDQGAVDVRGISHAHRFAFVDCAARPFMYRDSRPAGAGEILATVSTNLEVYSRQLGRILRSLIAPPISSSMRQFPRESRLSFQMFSVDASEVIGSHYQRGQAISTKTVPPGNSFNTQRFQSVIGHIFGTHEFHKEVTITSENLDVQEQMGVSMSISRAFHGDGPVQTVDADVFLRDRIRGTHLDHLARDRMSYFTDSSFVAHVPMLLLSFGDNGSEVQFVGRKNSKATLIGGQTIVMIENRRSLGGNASEDVTAFAIRETLELICGLNQEILSLVDTTKESLPWLILDAARRNILAQQLAWSYEMAVSLARSMLKLADEDFVQIPHGPDTDLGAAIALTRSHLNDTLQVWKRAGATLDTRNIENVTLRLGTTAAELRGLLYDQLCKQSIRDEVRLAVGNIDGGFTRGTSTRSNTTWLSGWVCSGIAGICSGVALAYAQHVRSKTANRTSSALPRQAFQPASTADAPFLDRVAARILPNSYKPKLN